MNSLPDFVKLAETFNMVGLRATKPGELDDVIKEMIKIDKPVIADIHVDQMENVLMIPSGAATTNAFGPGRRGGEADFGGGHGARLGHLAESVSRREGAALHSREAELSWGGLMQGEQGPGEICEVNAQNETVNSHYRCPVDNEPRVLTGHRSLSGRGYNIESLTVAKTDNVNDGYHRDYGHANDHRTDQGAAEPGANTQR